MPVVAWGLKMAYFSSREEFSSCLRRCCSGRSAGKSPNPPWLALSVTRACIQTQLIVFMPHAAGNYLCKKLSVNYPYYLSLTPESGREETDTLETQRDTRHGSSQERRAGELNAQRERRSRGGVQIHQAIALRPTALCGDRPPRSSAARCPTASRGAPTR